MARIYTKTGDDGKTSLVSGSRLMKSNFRIDAYGEVDELNSYIGLFITKLGLLNEKEFESDESLLTDVQSRLFDLGSNLACESNLREKFKLPSINENTIKEMESRIDKMSEELPPLKNFILPGGCEVASLAHVLRTITRRVERSMVKLEFEVGDELPDHSIAFINRLSDYFFILARRLNNHFQEDEKLWCPNSQNV